MTGGDSDHHQVAARAIKDHHHDDDDSDGRDRLSPAGQPRFTKIHRDLKIIFDNAFIAAANRCARDENIGTLGFKLFKS